MNILIKLMSIVSLVIAPHLRQDVKNSPRLQREIHVKSMLMPVKADKKV